MSPLRLVGGLPLVVGGQLAAADACCCLGPPCDSCTAGCVGVAGPLLVYTRDGITYWKLLQPGGIYASDDPTLDPCYVVDPETGLLGCYRAAVDGGATPEGWESPATGTLNVTDGVFEFAPEGQDPVDIAHGAIVFSGFMPGIGEVWIPLASDCTVDTANIRVLESDGETWATDWQVVCDSVCYCTKADGTYTVGPCGDCTDGRADDVFTEGNCDIAGVGACCDEDDNCTNETKSACDGLGFTWTHAALCDGSACPNPFP
jgi:hypothetical protein